MSNQSCSTLNHAARFATPRPHRSHGRLPRRGADSKRLWFETLEDRRLMSAVRPGFQQQTLPANDDHSAAAYQLAQPVDFFGHEYTAVYVNNNGNITFRNPSATYTPFSLTDTSEPIIAPFFADVDTRGAGSGLVTYGTGMVDGHLAFGVNFLRVGYYDGRSDKLNSFQLVLIDRSDTGRGNFDIEFNYDRIQWETGDASGGAGGLGGQSARVGFANGNRIPGTYFELPGSGVPGAFLDGGPNALVDKCINSPVRGREVFAVRGGVVQTPTPSPLPAMPVRPLPRSAVGNLPVSLSESGTAQPSAAEPGSPVTAAPAASAPVAAVPVALPAGPVLAHNIGDADSAGSAALPSDRPQVASQSASAPAFNLGQVLSWVDGTSDDDPAVQEEALLLALGDTTVPVVYTLDSGDLPPDPRPPAPVTEMLKALPEPIAPSLAGDPLPTGETLSAETSASPSYLRWAAVVAALAGSTGAYAWERTHSRRRSKALDELIFGGVRPAGQGAARSTRRETQKTASDDTVEFPFQETVLDWLDDTSEPIAAGARDKRSRTLSTHVELQLSEQWRHVAVAVDRYEEQVGDTLPDLAQLTAEISGPFRVPALAALVHVDQEYHWKRGSGRTVEQYLAAYPELRDQADVVRDLARTECRLRCRLHDTDFRKDFTARFPELELECDTRLTDATVTAGAAPQRCRQCPHLRPQRIGVYDVQQRIGGGAFGVVYRCRRADLDRQVAIKVARESSSSAAAFLHEARSVARLAHANIVRLLDYGALESGLPYLVYDYVSGRTLADRIAAGDYTMQQAIGWTVSVARALHAAHRQRLYHRDVKPANILIDEEGEARLTDFGLARRDDTFFIRDRGVRLGSPYYMSPEQAEGLSNWAGPASDVYALGVVLYELLCGRVPFGETDLDELLKQIRLRTPIPPRSLNDRIPPQVEEVCLRALAKSPADRFRTADDMARALEAALRGQCRRWPGIAIAAMFVLGVVLLAWQPWRRTAQPVASPAAAAGELQAGCPRVSIEDPDGTLADLTPENLPHAGERLHVCAYCNAPAYLYVIVFRSGGPARVSLNSAALNEDLEAHCPARGEKGIEIPAGRGVMAVVVGVRRTRLTEEELQRFTATAFDWPVPRRPKQFPATAHPLPAPRESPAELHLRASSVFDLPANFKPLAKQTFDAHYAVMFPWFDAPSAAGDAASRAGNASPKPQVP